MLTKPACKQGGEHIPSPAACLKSPSSAPYGQRSAHTPVSPCRKAGRRSPALSGKAEDRRVGLGLRNNSLIPCPIAEVREMKLLARRPRLSNSGPLPLGS